MGSAIASQSQSQYGITSIAIGDEKMSDEGVLSFCLGLKDVNGGSLKYVDFALKGMTKVGAEMIGTVFGPSQKFESLILYRNADIGDDGLEALCHAALESTSTSFPFPALKKIDVSECNIGIKGVESLVACLLEKKDETETRSSRLIDLSLNSNPIGSKACTHLAKLISSPSSEYSMLKSLSLKKCSIGDDGLEIIATTFINGGPQCGSLTFLDLSGNEFGSKGMTLLASAIKQGKENIKGLKELCLADNDKIGEEGIVALANSLIQLPANADGNSSLTILDLTNTNCGAGGASALMKCSSLSSLRLFNNSLGSEGIEAISSHLVGGHPYLKNLDLGGNRAKGKATAQLLRSIMKDQNCFKNSLETLELGGNENHDESLFDEARKKRPEIDIAPVKETPKDVPDDEEA